MSYGSYSYGSTLYGGRIISLVLTKEFFETFDLSEPYFVVNDTIIKILPLEELAVSDIIINKDIEKLFKEVVSINEIFVKILIRLSQKGLTRGKEILFPSGKPKELRKGKEIHYPLSKKQY